MSGLAAIGRCPQCGSELLVWPSPKNFSCTSCGFILYLNIAAAVAVIIECQDKILFGVRKNEPKRGMFDLPGGFVDQGETAEQALRREMQEELGVTVQDMRYLFSFPNKYLYCGIEYDTLDLIFLVRFDEFPQIQAADDLEAVIWFDRAAIEFDKIAFSSIRQAVRLYLADCSYR